MNNRQERFSYTLNIFFKKIKFVFLPLFFFTFLLLTLDVFAISAEEAANKMNEYMLDAVVNGKWEVKTFEDNTSQYEITIDLDTSPSDFEEVKNNVPTELFSGSDYKASAQLFYCSDSSCSDWNQWSADGIIDFELKKNSDGNPYSMTMRLDVAKLIFTIGILFIIIGLFILIRFILRKILEFKQLVKIF